MAPAKSPRRTRVERGIYRQPNGNFAVCARRAGRLHFRTCGRDLEGHGDPARSWSRRSPPGGFQPRRGCASKSKAWGGPQALHPSFRITQEFLDSIGGPGFESVIAQPVRVPLLMPYISLIRMRRDLRGQLRNPVYGITAGEVIGARSKPLSAQAVRDMIGLRADQLLVLLLFGKDKFLERLWNHRDQFLSELARGGFDLIVAPSYSLWEPRPRPEHLYALKRSLVIFQSLQELRAPAIPRVAWSVAKDAERLARWAADNPALSHVGVDLTTYRSSRDYATQLELLNTFDRLSGARLSYLVNGPSRLDRMQALYGVVSPGRIHIANSRAIARDSAPGTTFLEKEETEEKVVEAAQSVSLRSDHRSRPRMLNAPRA